MIKHFVTEIVNDDFSNVEYLEDEYLEGDIYEDKKAVSGNVEVNRVYTKQCRICSSQDNLNDLFVTQNGRTYADMLMMIGQNVHIARHDRGPQFICANCIAKLKVALHFKEQIETRENEFNSRSAPKSNRLTARGNSVQTMKLQKIDNLKQQLTVKQTMPTQYICKVCGNEYVNWNSLRLHSHKHVNSTNLKCKYCGRGFKIAAAYRTHVHRHLSGDDNGDYLPGGKRKAHYYCYRCKKQFANCSQLKAHIATIECTEKQ